MDIQIIEFTSDQPAMHDLRVYIAGDIPDKWKSVGRSLNISESVLNAYGAELVCEPEERMMRVFERWVRMKTKHPISWSTIVDVLSSKPLEEQALTNRIKEMFC